MNHALLTPDKRQNKDKIKNGIDIINNERGIKQDLDKYVLHKISELEESYSIESGYTKGKKEVRYRPSITKWDEYFYGIPLYNRNKEDPFSPEELKEIGKTIINYFKEKYDIKLILKIVKEFKINI